MSYNETIIISLGGSVIHPIDGINVDFLKKFNSFIRSQIKKKRQFFIICGGGYLTREYQKAVTQLIPKVSHEDLDWLGIHTTKLNAQLLRAVFQDIAFPKIIFKYDKIERNIIQPVVIAAGWKPGWSTDYDAVLLAKSYGAKTLINLSNIDVIYDKDPRIYKDAKPITKISWDDFEKIVGHKWTPGANTPFDPIATKIAKQINLTVFFLKGDNISNLENLLEGKPFKGTIIMPYRFDSSFFDRDYFELGIGYTGYTTTPSGRFFSHLANFYRALIIRLFLKPKTLLDVGCGTGLLVYYLRKMGVDAYGVDVSNYAVSKAYPSISRCLLSGSILKLPYSKKSFDVVTSFNVLEHLPKEQIPKALAECNRVKIHYCLHKVYTTENRWMEKFHGGDISHISVFPREWWRQLFRKIGLQEINIFFPKLPSFMETIFILNKNQ